MNKNSKQDLYIGKLFLMSGKSLQVTDTITVKHPMIDDVLNIENGAHCEDVYWAYVSVLYSDPYSQMVWLNDIGLDYEEVSPFEVFILKWLDAIKKNTPEVIELMNSALNFFLEGEHKFDLLPIGDEENNKVHWLLYDKETENCFINEDVFNVINFFVTQINNIDESGRIKPANEGAKKLLISQMRSEERRRRRNKNEKPSDSLAEAVSTAVWGSNGGVNVDNYKTQPIYMMTNGLKITIQRKNYEFVMGGVYAGTVKSDSISSELTYWMR